MSRTKLHILQGKNKRGILSYIPSVLTYKWDRRNNIKEEKIERNKLIEKIFIKLNKL